MKKILLFLFLCAFGTMKAQPKSFSTAQIDSICAIKNAKNVEILISNGDKKVLSDKQSKSGSHTIKGKGSFVLMVYNLLFDYAIHSLPDPKEPRKNLKEKVLLKGKLESNITFTNGNYEKIVATFYYQNNTIQLLEIDISKKTGKEQSHSYQRIPGDDIAHGTVTNDTLDGMPFAVWIQKKNEEILNLFKK